MDGCVIEYLEYTGKCVEKHPDNDEDFQMFVEVNVTGWNACTVMNQLMLHQKLKSI